VGAAVPPDNPESLVAKLWASVPPLVRS